MKKVYFTFNEFEKHFKEWIESDGVHPENPTIRNFDNKVRDYLGSDKYEEYCLTGQVANEFIKKLTSGWKSK